MCLVRTVCVRSLSGGSWRSRDRPRDSRDSYSRSRHTSSHSNRPKISNSSLKRSPQLQTSAETLHSPRPQPNGAKFPNSSSLWLKRAEKFQWSSTRTRARSSHWQAMKSPESRSCSSQLWKGPKPHHYRRCPRQTGAGFPNLSSVHKKKNKSLSLSRCQQRRILSLLKINPGGARSPRLCHLPRARPIRHSRQIPRAPPLTQCQSERWSLYPVAVIWFANRCLCLDL